MDSFVGRNPREQVVAEGGVEGLTAYLASMGQSGAKVLTPDEIKRRQAAGESVLGNAEL